MKKKYLGQYDSPEDMIQKVYQEGLETANAVLNTSPKEWAEAEREVDAEFENHEEFDSETYDKEHGFTSEKGKLNE